MLSRLLCLSLFLVVHQWRPAAWLHLLHPTLCVVIICDRCYGQYLWPCPLPRCTDLWRHKCFVGGLKAALTDQWEYPESGQGANVSSYLARKKNGLDSIMLPWMAEDKRPVKGNVKASLCFLFVFFLELVILLESDWRKYFSIKVSVLLSEHLSDTAPFCLDVTYLTFLKLSQFPMLKPF